MNVDTEVLRWFQRVVDGMTVTEVAEIDRVSQPGVSRALARLGEQVGTPLLYRTGRILRPTQAGNEFKHHAEVALHALDDALAAVNELVDPEAGIVVIAFQPSFGPWLVPDLIRRFRQDHPRVQFRLERSDDALGSSLVARGRIDLELTARRPRNPEVRWEHLFTQPLLLAVPAEHPLAGTTQASLSDVAEEPFVMLHPSWALRTLTDELCTAAGFRPRVAFEADDLAVVRGFVSSGLGVAVVPPMEHLSSARSFHAESLVRLSDSGAHREVGLAWSARRRLLPSGEMFRESVLHAFA